MNVVAYRAINELFRCFNTDNANALIRGYKSFVRPILEYCPTVWNPFIHAKYYLGMVDELENIQRYFTRRLYYRCRLDCNHDYLERINNLKLESLELRRIYNDMTMVFKIVHKFINLNESDLVNISPWARGRNFTYRYHLWWQRLVMIFIIGHVSAIYFDMIALSGWQLKIVMSSFIPTPNETRLV